MYRAGSRSARYAAVDGKRDERIGDHTFLTTINILNQIVTVRIFHLLFVSNHYFLK